MFCCASSRSAWMRNPLREPSAQRFRVGLAGSTMTPTVIALGTTEAFTMTPAATMRAAAGGTRMGSSAVSAPAVIAGSAPFGPETPHPEVMTMPSKAFAVERWRNHEFSSGSYAGEDYLAFQRAAKKDLKNIAQSAGFQLHGFNPNHYCFSAVLQHEGTGAFVYVSVGDVRGPAGRWYDRVLYRTMRHEKDWTGGINQWCRWDELAAALSQMRCTKGGGRDVRTRTSA